MNTYPNASDGVKQIFLSEIFGLIGAVLAVITAFFGAAFVGSAFSGSTAGTVASAGLAGIFGILTVGVAIAAFVLKILGLNKAGKDNRTFLTALLVVLIAALIALLNAFIKSSILSSIGDILDFVVLFFVVKGVTELLPGTEFEQNGKTIVTLGFIVMIIGIVVAILGRVKFITILGGIASFICSVVYYIMYLIFLNKAKNSL